MALIDIVIIVIYFAAMILVGLWVEKKASVDMEAYFLGGRSMSWMFLAMSGSVTNFDISGTMWIVSVIYLLGMKSMWHHWMWGFLMGAFFLSYMGKWVRKSNVVTAAEWMVTRFGSDTGGKLARTAYAVMAILTLASFTGYAYVGIGKFAAVYVPLESLADRTSIVFLKDLFTNHEASVLALLIVGLTTVYVVTGGLYSVVVTDVIQTVILTIGAIIIAGIAWAKMTPDLLSRLPTDFTSLSIPWRIPKFAGTANAEYEFFGVIVIMWVLKGLLLNLGGPGQMYDFQRFLAARSPKDAAKVGAAWSGFLLSRWAMTMGIALLAITGAAGVSDAEQVMPIVLRDLIPVGIRGLIIAGLLSAFMSTFSGTLNSGAAFIVRDLWQTYVNPNLTNKQAVRLAQLATVLLVVIGIIIGLMGDSITKVWGWIMMALGAGVIVPNVLRWYWWRFNGWGYAMGVLGGMLLSLVVLFFPKMPMHISFPMITAASLIISIITSYLTKPVNEDILVSFYKQIRPFGIWKPVRNASGLTKEELQIKSENPGLAVFNVVIGMTAIFSSYMFPMYFVGHWYKLAAIWFVCMAVAIVILKYSWYDKLEETFGETT